MGRGLSGPRVKKMLGHALVLLLLQVQDIRHLASREYLGDNRQIHRVREYASHVAAFGLFAMALERRQ